MKIIQKSPTNHSLPCQQETLETFGSSVPLHVLCDSCKEFAESFDLISWSDFQAGGPFEFYGILCTVEYLLKEAHKCHLCQLIVAVMDERNGTDLLETQESIQVFLALDKYVDSINISVRLSRDVAPCSLQLEILTFDHETDKGLPPPLQWTHIPANSGDNTRMIQEWLHACLTKHNRCRTFLQNSFYNDQRPTRVLDLSNEKLRLLCNTSKVDSFEYLTLSHMWGSTPSLQVRLVQENLTKFESDLPTEDLSLIYKDAIRITRILGYRYLWIDSLCIIQDSESDWKAEASKMASVYGNSTCNLSYLFPPENLATKERGDPRSLAPCVLRPPTKLSEGLYVSRPKNGREWRTPDRWPLLSRGWVFQELMLCPRNIFLGHKAVMWECSELFHDELFGKVMIHWGIGRSRAVSKSDLHPKSKDDTSLNSDIATDSTSIDIWWQTPSWGSMVLEYRSKKLSFSNDRAIAFAGIARAIHKLHGLTYLAGLWEESFPIYLAWAIKRNYIGANTKPLGKIDEAGVSTAPSWSWFSAPIRRGYLLGFPYLEPAKERQRYISWIKVTSISWEEKTTHRNPDSLFYDFTGLGVTVELMTLTGKLVQSKPTGIKLHVPAFEKVRISYRYYHDDVSELLSSDNQLPSTVSLGIVLEERREDLKRDEVFKHLQGLALIPSSNGNTWRRVGMWAVDQEWDSDSLYADENSLFHHLEGWKMEEMTLV